MSFIPIFLIVIPILASLFIYLLKKRMVIYLALGTQSVLIVLSLVYFLTFTSQGVFEAPLVVIGGWNPKIGISLAVDSLSMAFAFLTIFSWSMVLIYIFDRKKTDYNLLFFLMFLQGVFLGIIQTNDLFNMFVFVELTTIIVTILIAYKKSGSSFRAAIYYLLLNTSGVLAFLIGIILIYNTFGTINISYVTENIHLHRDTATIRVAFALMLSGISVKAAIFPVFTWLPKAHGSAQSSISALLSGLIVKGGIYLLIRINLIMFAGAAYSYSYLLFSIGALSAATGIIFALTQNDIKQLLAYSTISQVGLIVMGLSSQNPLVFAGGVYHIFNHALFKMMLFFGAGIIIKVYHTKKLDELRGVFRSLPLISLMMIVSMLAITGLPFLNGNISKSMIMYGYGREDFRYWIIFILNIGTATLFVKLARVFFGPQSISGVLMKPGQNIVMIVLAIACVLLGIFYQPLARIFLEIDVSNLTVVSLRSSIDYLAFLAMACILYWYIFRKDSLFVVTLRHYTVSFETANYVFMSYITLMMIYYVWVAK